MEKKTAVEQFIEQLEIQGDSWENVSIGRIQISIKVEDYLELQRQAKEIEKEQIMDAYEMGDANGWNDAVYRDEPRYRRKETYYKETFNN